MHVSMSGVPRKNKPRRQLRQGTVVRGIGRRLNGGELKPAAHPPEFTSRPWFSLTVRVQDVPTIFTVDLLLTALLSQLGFSALTPANLAVRIRSVRIWAPLVGFSSTTPLQPLTVAIADFIRPNDSGTAATERTLEQYTRYPDQVQRASVGYRYGETHSSIALTSTTIAARLLTCVGAGAGSVAYFEVLFRPNVPTVGLDGLRLDDPSDSEVELLDEPRTVRGVYPGGPRRTSRK